MSYYELVKSDKKIINGNTLCRIRATKDFENPYRNVKKGELGGYINSYMYGNSWVFGNTVAYNCDLTNGSYIVGDHTYRGIHLNNSSIQGTGDYYNDTNMNYVHNVDIIGHNFIKGSRHSVIWGVDKNTKEIKISVGCQFYSLNYWKTFYTNIALDKNYTDRVSEYLGYLKQIEESLKPTNENILEKISSNISSMKVSVTEALKSETISLVNSLQVSTQVVSKGPQRDKFGRFVKKTP